MINNNTLRPYKCIDNQASNDISQQNPPPTLLTNDNPEAPLPFNTSPLLANCLTKDKISNFIHGEIFKFKALEGGSTLENLQILELYIREMDLLEDGEHTTNLITQCIELELTYDFSYLLNRKEASYDKCLDIINEYSAELSTQILKMEPGERLLMLGGWVNECQGHAMVYLIEAQEDDQCAFTVINTGAGLEFHQNKVDGLKTKYSPAYRIKDIPIEQIANPDFIIALKQLQLPYTRTGDNWDHKAEDLYQLLPELDGVRDLDFETQIEFITSQRMGSCSWKSIMKFLALELANVTDYKYIQFELKFRTLCLSLHHLHQNPGLIDAQRVEMLHSFLVNFSKTAVKFYERQIIVDRELISSYEFVKIANEKILNWRKQTSPTTVRLDFSQSPILSGLKVPLKLFLPIPFPSARTNLFKPPLLTSTNDKTISSFDSLHELNLFLRQFTSFLKAQNTIQNYPFTISHVMKMFTSMQKLGLEKNGYWDNLCAGKKPEEIENTLEQFEYIHRLFFSAITHMPKIDKRTPDQIAILCNLLAINLKIAEHLPSDNNPLGKMLFVNLRSLFKAFDCNHYAIINHASLRSMFYEARTYLEKGSKQYLLEERARSTLALKEDEDQYLAESNNLDDVFSYLTSKNATATFRFDEKELSFHVGTASSEVVEGLKLLLSNRCLIEKASLLWPKIKSTDHRKILAKLFATWGDEVSPVPKSYQLVMQQKLSLTCLLGDTDFTAASEQLRFEIKQNNVNALIVSVQIDGIHSITEQKGISKLFENCQTKIEEPDLQALFVNINSIDNHSWHDGVDWYSKAGSNLIKNVHALPLREVYELGVALCNPRLRIANMCAYFSTYPDKLLLQDYQLLFYYALFSSHNPEQRLSSLNSELCREVIAFLKLQYEIQKTMSNTKVQLFYLWICERLADISPQIAQDLQIDINSELLSIADKIQGSCKENKQLKCQLYQQFMANFYRRENLSGEEVFQLAKAFAYIKAFGLNRKDSHPSIIERMHQTEVQMFIEIQKKDKSFHLNLAKAIDTEIFATQDSVWEGECPHYHAKQGDLEIDISTLSIRQGGAELGELPLSFQKHPSFRKIFDGRSFLTKSPQVGAYEIQIENSDRLPEKYHIFFSTEGQLIIQKLIDGFWCSLIESSHLRDSIGNYKQKHDLSLHHLYWADPNNRIWVQDEATRVMNSIIHLNPFSEESLSIEGWYKLTAQKADLKLNRKDIYELSDINGLFLRNFHTREGIHVWGDELIEFPKFQIQFRRDGQQRYRFSEDSQYYLAETQSPAPHFSHLLSFLRLESETNKIRYLIPHGKIVSWHQNYGPFTRQIQIQGSCENGRCFAFELINDELVGQTTEEHIFLAYLHFCHKNYEQAAALLKQYRAGRPKGFSDKELKALALIFNQWNTAADESPAALTIYLQAGYLYITGLGNTTSEDIDNYQELFTSILGDYYLVANHSKLLALTPLQELEMINFIIDNENPHDPVPDLIFERQSELSSILLPAKSQSNLNTALPLFKPTTGSNIEFTNSKHLYKRLKLDPGSDSLPYLPANGMTEEELNNHLRGLTPSVNASKVELAEYKRIHASIKKAHLNQLQKKTFHLSDAQLKNVINDLNGIIPDLKKRADDDLKNVLCIANSLPLDQLLAIRQQLEIFGENKKIFTIDDLIILLLQNNSAELLKHNPSLNPEHISQLSIGLVKYLIKTTQCDYLIELHHSCEEALASTGLQKIKCLDEVCERLLHDRIYNPATDPTLLIFEHYSGVRLRAVQVETIKTLISGVTKESKQNAITQIIQNSGKTTIISPLIAYLLSQGFTIPIFVVPDELFETGLEDTRLLSGQRLKQEVETLILAKDTQLDVAGIEAIIKKFEKIKQNRSYCLVNATTMHNLRLNFSSICNELADIPPGLSPNINLAARYDKMRELSNLLKAEGVSIIDEIDLVLEHRKQVNSAKGKWQAVKPSTKECFFKVFEAIVSRPTLREFLKIDRESETPIDLFKFQHEIQPQLVEMFTQLAGMQNLASKEKLELEQYLLSSDKLTKRPDFIAHANIDIRHLLALGKQMIRRGGLLTAVIDQKCNEDFGLSHTLSSDMAIPYAQKDQPSEGSEFSCPYETMMYSMLYYTRNGVSAKQLDSLILRMRGDVLNELKDEQIPLKETSAFKKFSQLNLIPGKDLFSIQIDELESAVNVFNAKIENRMLFAKLFGWNGIGLYSERVPSNPLHLIDMTGQAIGFGATVSNKDTYHKNLHVIPEETTDGYTLNLLYKSNPKVIPFDLQKNDFLKSLSHYQACIDAGAWFRGLNAKKTAQQILKYLPAEMKGIIYINDTDSPSGTLGLQVFLERDSDAPKLLSQVKCPKHERFTYFNVTTGVNIAQDDLAKAIVTISRNLTLDRLLQGVWRMRGLARQQKVDFAIPIELEEVFGPASFKMVEQLTIRNQAAKQENDNLPALKNKIAYEIEHLVETVLRSLLLDVRNAARICKEVKNIISKKTYDDLEQLFGEIDHEVITKVIIEDCLLDAENSIKSAYEKFPKEFTSVISFEDLKTNMRKLVNYDLLPVSEFKGKAQGNQTVQINTNMNVNQQLQLQLKITEEKAKFNNHHPKALHRWRQTSYYSKWFMEKCLETTPIQKYLKGHVHQFANPKSNLSFFSKRLSFSRNFLYEDSGAAPLNGSSKPIGISLLQRDTNGRLTMTALSAAEVEKMWQVLEAECDFNKDVIISQEIAYKKALGSIVLQVFDEDLKNEGGFFKSRSLLGLKAFRAVIEKSLRSQINIKDESIEMVLNQISWEPVWIENLKMALIKCGINPEQSKILTLLKKQKEFMECYTFTREQVITDIANMGVTQFMDILTSNDSSSYPNGSQRRIMFKIKQLVRENGYSENWRPHLPYSKALQIFDYNKELELFLVDPVLGIIKTGKKQWDHAEKTALENDPQYIRLMSQAKYYNGVLDNYKKNERAYLTKWFKKNDPIAMEEFFINNVLAAKPTDLSNYPKSVIRRSIANCLS